MSTLLQHRTNLKYALRDISTTNPRIGSTYYDNWINRGIARIAMRSMFYERASALLPDGTNRIYDLIGSAVGNVASDYIGLKAIKHSTQGTLKVSRLEEEEDYEASGSLTGALPTVAYIFRDKIAFDAIMDGTEMIDDTDDRTFTSDTGNWTNSDADNTFAVSGGRGRLTIGASPTTSLLSLADAYIDELTIDRWYVLTLDLNYVGGWTGGIVTVTINGSSNTITLSTTSTAVVVKFQAQATASSITITCASAPTVGNIMEVDNVSLQESPISIYYYGTPPTLSVDGDIPVYPLSLAAFDGLIKSAALLEYADDEGDSVLIEKEAIMFDTRYAEFVTFIEHKGKQYAKEGARAHRI